jgi:hypothetical protein
VSVLRNRRVYYIIYILVIYSILFSLVSCCSTPKYYSNELRSVSKCTDVWCKDIYEDHGWYPISEQEYIMRKADLINEHDDKNNSVGWE